MKIIIPPDSMLKMTKQSQSAIVFAIALPCVSYGYSYYVSYYFSPFKNDFPRMCFVQIAWDVSDGWIKEV